MPGKLVVDAVFEAYRALEAVEDSQNLFRPRADSIVLRQIHPANRARCVDQEFRGPRDVALVRATLGVDDIVLPDDFTPRIGEEQVRIALLLGEIQGLSRRINADADESYAARFKLLQLLLETP